MAPDQEPYPLSIRDCKFKTVSEISDTFHQSLRASRDLFLSPPLLSVYSSNIFNSLQAYRTPATRNASSNCATGLLLAIRFGVASPPRGRSWDSLIVPSIVL